MLLEQVPLLPTPSRGSSSARHGNSGPSHTVSKNGSNSHSPASQHAESSASSSTTSKKRPPNEIKRKRSTMSATPTDGPTDGDHDQSAIAKEKKKKASRACCHCQKAHLTCDDSRPCQRCIKRGIAETCAEGHRKKAKYLLDEDELEALKKGKDHSKDVEPTSATDSQPPALPTPQPQSTPDTTQALPSASSNFMPSPLFPSSSDPIYNIFPDHSYPFDSTAANMEYSMLSAILGNPSAQEDATAIPPSPPPSTTIAHLPMLSNSSWPSMPMDNQPFNFANGLKNNPLQSPSASFFDHSQVSNGEGSINPSADLQFRAGDGALGPLTPPASDPTPASPAMVAVSPGTQARFPPGAVPSTALSRSQRSALVYSSVTKPFDYVDGYHYLMQYLQGRFDKMDILRIVRALAIFRPSLIALQMDLSEEDEIFAEKCYQRTLIELEKLISFSGTPTVVWRRTGEICLVGVEFTMLTEWTTEDLVSKRKFIYELFEHQSVVEYWEKFASHAFESSSQSVNCHCVLLKPSGDPIPCAFCFSIRRDVFDLPNVVIGQWLPLL